MKNRFNFFIAFHRLVPGFLRPLFPVPTELVLDGSVFENGNTGVLGEDLAEIFFSFNRYKLLERNYRCRLGEIDFILQDKNKLVFVEVKTRRSTVFGTPEEAVDATKQVHIGRVALYYLKKNNIVDHCARFDVLSVLIDKKNKKVIFNQVKDAFELISHYRY